jgi:hypothetical protein
MLHQIPVGLHYPAPRPALHPRPIPLHRERLHFPRGLEEFFLRQQLCQTLPLTGLLELVRQLLHLSRPRLRPAEVARQPQMRFRPLLFCSQIPPLHRGPQELVEKPDPSRPAHQRRLGRQIQRRPMCPRQRLTLVAQQFKEFLFHQPPACRPQRRHRIADQTRTLAFIILFVARQDFLVQRRNIAGREVVGDPGVQKLGHAEHAKLLQKRPQIQRVRSLRRRGDPLRAIGAERFCVQRQAFDNQLAALAHDQRVHSERRPAPLVQVFERSSWQRGNHQPHAFRNHRRQPDQIRRAVAVLQPVQRVEHQHHPAPRRRPVQRVGEHLPQGLGLIGNLDLHAELPPELAQDPPLRSDPGAPARRVRAGMSKTRAQERRSGGCGPSRLPGVRCFQTLPVPDRLRRPGPGSRRTRGRPWPGC